MIKYRFGSYIKPKKSFPVGIIKICKKHGQLTENETCRVTFKKSNKTYIFCKKCRSINHKNLRNKNPEKMDKQRYNYYLKSKFNLTQDQYNQLLKKQNGLCAICKNTETQLRRKSKEYKLLSVDHCHKTKKIRGLLCHKCNVSIGLLNDSIERMEEMIKYLKSSI